MKFVKRFLPLLVLGALILASCATNAGQVPKGTETPPTVAQGGQQQVQQQAQPQQPSVEKYELQNLFQQAATLKTEVTDFDLGSVLPDKYKVASAEHDSVAEEYKTLVETSDPYDGVKAYPLKSKIEQLISKWDALIQEGMPLKADAEKEAANDMRFAAMNADAPTQAPTQYDAGLQTFAQASTFVDAANFAQAIQSYRLAATMFENAAAAASANALRSDIESNGYASYESIQMYFSMAESKYNEAQGLWQKNTKEDIQASTSAFKEAQSYYEFVDSKGAELRAFEGKDKALSAQKAALEVKADVNVPDEYQQAVDILAEADQNMQAGNYVSAYAWYSDAANAFEAATTASNSKSAEVADAIAQAETDLQEAKSRAAEVDLDNNVYLISASEHLDAAKALNGQMQYADALFEAHEVSNYIGLSDTMVNQEVQAREKARAEQIAKDKAAADQSIADARERMAWADRVDLKSDYPQEYKDASTSMSGAEIAYGVERYESAKQLADQVSATLSDSFQLEVIGAREAARAKAVQAEELAQQKIANKQAADVAIADAEARMAWANENQIRSDFPDEYKSASVAMVGAYVAYGNEDYVQSSEKAKEVSSILSDSFKTQVASERAAAAQRAADKAEADKVMPQARARMAWADQNNIKADYAQEYKNASSSMSGAEIAYGVERYASATELANEVLSILSSDFEAKVASERAAQQMDSQIQLAAKAANALGDAHSRMAWADQANISEEYPDEYRDANTSMQAADMAYSQQSYDATIALSGDVARVLSDEFMANVNSERAAAAQRAADKAEADKVMPQARARMAWADQNNIKADYAQEYKNASSSMSGAEIAYGVERYSSATQLANEVLSTLSSDFEAKVASDRAAQQKAVETDQNMKYAQVAISDAQARYDWATSKNAAHNYPDLLNQGGGMLADAKAAFNSQDYSRAKDLAGKSYWTLMQIEEFAPLPATYKVRLIPERRDCLWRIAEYQFIYNNPYKWPVLYEANKKTFKDPSNPDLIFPGQILKIPSIKGETRQGEWDSLKTYKPLAK